MNQVQEYLLANGYTFREILPQFHHYHLDDDPELTSCSLIAQRNESCKNKAESISLEKGDLENFYGAYAPLAVRYVRDLRKGGALPSADYRFEQFGQK